MTKKFYVTLILLLAVGSIGSFFGWRFFKETEEWAFSACLASIDADLHKLGDKIPISISETDDWRLLNEGDTEILLQSVKLYDCKGKGVSDLRDPWGNRVLIAYKHNSSETTFLVWTSGKDNISGNPDDLVHPFKTQTIPDR